MTDAADLLLTFGPIYAIEPLRGHPGEYIAHISTASYGPGVFSDTRCGAHKQAFTALCKELSSFPICRRCPACHSVNCSDCGGSGELHFAMSLPQDRPCPGCGGSGRVLAF